MAVAQDTAMLKAMLIQDHRIFCQLEEEEEKQGYSGALSLLCLKQTYCSEDMFLFFVFFFALQLGLTELTRLENDGSWELVLYKSQLQ